MWNLLAVLPVILLVFQGLPVPSSSDPVWGLEFLTNLNDVVTKKIKRSMEELEDSSILEAKESYLTLKEAAELPFLQLDEKIMAYNNYEKVYGVRQNPELESDADSTTELTEKFPVKKRTIFTLLFETSVFAIFSGLGIFGSLASRVWNALLCDKKKARKLKKKIEALSCSLSKFTCKRPSHKSSSSSSSSYYGIFDIFFYSSSSPSYKKKKKGKKKKDKDCEEIQAIITDIYKD
ncbi:uncharacterized protein [Drosophila pseudoobscura]|uniref:Uncharacterized protein isoform X1 n=1 Tax=Drosophila pseudoobscura pseudoobscura TaxID=46245 RepID=A0A6I8V9W3_DROPS|nr:uncharacterized protein LOC6902699 isoform X1 [Drosophila pseudoobscura]